MPTFYIFNYVKAERLVHIHVSHRYTNSPLFSYKSFPEYFREKIKRSNTEKPRQSYFLKYKQMLKI